MMIDLWEMRKEEIWEGGGNKTTNKKRNSSYKSTGTTQATRDSTSK